LDATGQRCPVTSAPALARTHFEDTLFLLKKQLPSDFFLKKHPKVTNDL